MAKEGCAETNPNSNSNSNGSRGCEGKGVLARGQSEARVRNGKRYAIKKRNFF